MHEWNDAWRHLARRFGGVAVFAVDVSSVLQIIFKSFEWCDFLFDFFIHKIGFQFMMSSLL